MPVAQLDSPLGLTWELVVQNGIDALSLGALYALFALGIALIFGVMRLVNFAHGELIMLGGFTLYYTDALHLAWRVVISLAIVTIGALLMERVAFRPVRQANPAVLLVTSFGVSFGLQNLTYMIAGAVPKSTPISASLSQSFFLGDVAISKLNVLVVIVTIVLLVSLAVVLGRTRIGIQMRASAEDFTVARVLGVRADTVIALAFALSGALAAVAAILYVAQTGAVTTTMGLQPVLIAFVATIIGGLGSLPGAVLGGLVLGALTVGLQSGLPLELRPFRDAFVFGAVLLVLVLRPQGLLVSRALQGPADRSSGGYNASWSSLLPRRRGRRVGEHERNRLRAVVRTLAVDPSRLRDASALRALVRDSSTPFVLAAMLVAVALLGSLGDAVLDRVVVTGLVNLVVVVGLYSFIGLSGVFSFGHVAFMAIGAYTAGLLTMDPGFKERLLPELPGFIAEAKWPAVAATLFGGFLAAVLAAVLSLPITRISGLTASLAMFAVLLIVNVVIRNWENLTNGTKALGPVPTTTTRDVALAWAVLSIFAVFLFERTRVGLTLKTSREDEVAARAMGVRVARERAVAFILSAFIVGGAGGLFAQLLNSFSPDAFFLSLTFFTIAMLVVGGFTSLSGAVVGTIVVTAVGEALRRLETGVDLGPITVDSPSGLREVGIAALILGVLALRPRGIMNGKEIRIPPRRQPELSLLASTRPTPAAAAENPAKPLDLRG